MTKEQIEKLQEIAEAWFYEDLAEWKECECKGRRTFLEERMKVMTAVVTECISKLHW